MGGMTVRPAQPFGVPSATGVFTTKRIAEGSAPILGVVHDLDGDWQFLDGGAVTRDTAVLIHLAHVVEWDPAVLEVAGLPVGWQAWRSDVGCAWERQPHRLREEDDEVG